MPQTMERYAELIATIMETAASNLAVDISELEHRRRVNKNGGKKHG